MRASLCEVLEKIRTGCQSYGEKINEMAGDFAVVVYGNVQSCGSSVVPDDHVSNLRGVGKHASCGTQAN